MDAEPHHSAQNVISRLHPNRESQTVARPNQMKDSLFAEIWGFGRLSNPRFELPDHSRRNWTIHLLSLLFCFVAIIKLPYK